MLRARGSVGAMLPSLVDTALDRSIVLGYGRPGL